VDYFANPPLTIAKEEIMPTNGTYTIYIVFDDKNKEHLEKIEKWFGYGPDLVCTPWSLPEDPPKLPCGILMDATMRIPRSYNHHEVIVRTPVWKRDGEIQEHHDDRIDFHWGEQSGEGVDFSGNL
jgi:hypothetical protein